MLLRDLRIREDQHRSPLAFDVSLSVALYKRTNVRLVIIIRWHAPLPLVLILLDLAILFYHIKNCLIMRFLIMLSRQLTVTHNAYILVEFLAR